MKQAAAISAALVLFVAGCLALQADARVRGTTDAPRVAPYTLKDVRAALATERLTLDLMKPLPRAFGRPYRNHVAGTRVAFRLHNKYASRHSTTGCIGSRSRD